MVVFLIILGWQKGCEFVATGDCHKYHNFFLFILIDLFASVSSKRLQPWIAARSVRYYKFNCFLIKYFLVLYASGGKYMIL